MQVAARVHWYPRCGRPGAASQATLIGRTALIDLVQHLSTGRLHMSRRLHDNARTRPAVRHEIRQVIGSGDGLAERFGWIRRASARGASAQSRTTPTTPPTSRQATQGIAQNFVVVALRTPWWSSDDDLRSVFRGFIFLTVSRSAWTACRVFGASRSRPRRQGQHDRPPQAPNHLPGVGYLLAPVGPTLETCRPATSRPWN